ncbi:MAG: hypothetical protein R2827_10040 [Bdellovibrionales bacterium]
MTRYCTAFLLSLVLNSTTAFASISACSSIFLSNDLVDFGRNLYSEKSEPYDISKFEPNDLDFIQNVRIPELRKNAEANGGSTDVFYERASNGESHLYLGANRALTGGHRVHPDSKAVIVFISGQGGVFSYVNSVLRVVSGVNSRNVSKNQSTVK